MVVGLAGKTVMPTAVRDIFAMRDLDCPPIYFGSDGLVPCLDRLICNPVRETVYDYIVRCGKLANIHLQPVFQRPDPITNKRRYPAIVYTELSSVNDTTLDGPMTTAVSFRFDVRGPNYSEVAATRDIFVDCLKRGGRVVDELGILDEYDVELNIYRKIQTLDLLP